MHKVLRIKHAIASFLMMSLLSVCSVSAYADSGKGWQFGVGAEKYTWKEYISGIAITPKESGDRIAIFLGWSPTDISGKPYLTYVGKIYGGSVNYDTATIVGTVPTQTSSNYFGMINEARGFIPTNYFDVVVGLGYDYWTRSLADGVTSTGTFVQGYTETYDIVFMRLGLSANIGSAFGLAGGVKRTLINNESALTGTMHPGTSTTPYLEASYKLAPNIHVAAYYDAYRFSQSPVSGTGFYQPKSNMDALGIKFTWSEK